jgi:hypothetical protein
MPVYFAHGFRWPRAGFTGIRVHIIFHNLEDCSAEYVQNAPSQASILASFHKAWPEVMRELDDESQGGRGRGLTLLEEYDPEDETSEMAASRPWAFVCDFVRVLPTGKASAVLEGGPRAAGGPDGGKGKGKEKEKEVGGPGGGAGVGSILKGPALSINVTELIAQGPGSTPKAWDALADLRDKIADGEKIDWWVIYNGDPERAYDVTGDSGYDEEEDEDTSMAEEQGEEIYADQRLNRKTFVPQDEAIRRMSPARQAQAEARMEQRPKSSPRPKGMTPPPVPPAKDRDKGKRTPSMRAFPPPEKAIPPLPALTPAMKPVVKTETGLKKKFFGKK